MRRFEQDLYNFFTSRINASNDLQKKDPEYPEAYGEYEKIWAEVEALAGKDLMLELDSALCSLSTMDIDYAYKQGFCDGMKLEEMIKGIIPPSSNDNYEE